ncbi:MAG: PTS sugar transporter subunit IIA [Candidatus Cloacimonetes bacterium]|nr:PTS sugar transporter subunit IIA [Candidatus Cloacimonadota bacterium]
MDLTGILKLECCSTNIQSQTKELVLEELVKLVKRNEILKDVPVAELLESFHKRERQGSTGFGKGIAIPHCQISGIKDFVVGIGISHKGVEYDAIDHKKVKIFVVIVGPLESRSGHLQLLATVSRILKEPQIEQHLLHQESKIGLLDEFLRHSPETHTVSAQGKDKLLLLVVRDPDIMEEISEIFMEYGVEEATILDTSSMEGILSHVPLFLGFFDFTGDREKSGKLIMVKLPRDYLQALVHGLEDAFGNLDDFTGLALIVLDIFFSKGI